MTLEVPASAEAFLNNLYYSLMLDQPKLALYWYNDIYDNLNKNAFRPTEEGKHVTSILSSIKIIVQNAF